MDVKNVECWGGGGGGGGEGGILQSYKMAFYSHIKWH